MLAAGAMVVAAWGLRAQEAAPSLPAAVQRMQANDPAGAEKILLEVLQKEPENSRAWRMLSQARSGQKNFDGAIEAARRALETDPANVSPLYTLASLHASKKDAGGAFEWLAKAKASRKIDMTQITNAPEFAALRDDPRFAAMLPAAADFEDPFVEPVKIVRRWDGEAANDQFGWIARGAGDVDGDGIADIVTSAPTANNGAGRVYVYSTKSGKLLWSANGAPRDQLGIGIEGAGDTNKDGIPDVIASGPGGGVAYVYSGRDGKVLLTLRAENRADGFGRHVDTAGDVNGDGHADVIVGAPGHGGRTGRAYVYSGKDGKVLWTGSGERAGDAYGAAVAGWSGKGGFLVLVGAPGAGPRSTGRAYVYDTLSDKPKFTMESDETGGALAAMFLAVPGDMDGDGFPEVFTTDWANSAKGPSTGRAYAHSGKDGKRLFTFTGETAGDGKGSSASMAGDVDGDGRADLIIGAWQYGGAAVSGGRAYLYSGRDGKLLKTFTCKTPGDTFGFDAVGIGDTDGDGTVDLLITSAWSGVKGYHSGRVFLVSSGVRKSKPR